MISLNAGRWVFVRADFARKTKKTARLLYKKKSKISNQLFSISLHYDRLVSTDRLVQKENDKIELFSVRKIANDKKQEILFRIKLHSGPDAGSAAHILTTIEQIK